MQGGSGSLLGDGEPFRRPACLRAAARGHRDALNGRSARSGAKPVRLTESLLSADIDQDADIWVPRACDRVSLRINTGPSCRTKQIKRIPVNKYSGLALFMCACWVGFDARGLLTAARVVGGEQTFRRTPRAS